MAHDQCMQIPKILLKAGEWQVVHFLKVANRKKLNTLKNAKQVPGAA